jgi:hypothetical protein
MVSPVLMIESFVGVVIVTSDASHTTATITRNQIRIDGQQIGTPRVTLPLGVEQGLERARLRILQSTPQFQFQFSAQRLAIVGAVVAA